MEAVSRSNALGHAGSMAPGEVASAEAGAYVWGPSALSRADPLCAVQPMYRRVAGKLVKAVVLLPVRSTGPHPQTAEEQRSPGSSCNYLSTVNLTPSE